MNKTHISLHNNIHPIENLQIYYLKYNYIVKGNIFNFLNYISYSMLILRQIKKTIDNFPIH